jgi:hypothetical protein
MIHALRRLSWPGVAGHPRLLADADEEDVDGPDTPGHDSGIEESLSTSGGISCFNARLPMHEV